MTRRGLLVALALVALVGCSRGADSAAPTTTAEVTTTAPQDQEMFEKIGLELVRKDGKVCQLCVKIANTPEKRAVGLTGEGALDGVDGMLFYSGEPMTDAFWMSGVEVPLDIHFFTMKGAALNTVSAVPCAAGTPAEKCPRYKALAAYGYALEVSPALSKTLGLAGASLGSIMENCPEKARVITTTTTTKPTKEKRLPQMPKITTTTPATAPATTTVDE